MKLLDNIPTNVGSIGGAILGGVAFVASAMSAMLYLETAITAKLFFFALFSGITAGAMIGNWLWLRLFPPNSDS